MVERRWLIGLGPPVAAMLALGLVGTSPAGAVERAWDPPPCDGDSTPLAEAATAAPPGTPDAPVPAAWFTLDTVLDASGSLAGQRLGLGLGGPRSPHLVLPPESSAAGPFGRVVLVVADDERQSVIDAIDVNAGCAWRLGTSTDVIRRVTLDRVAEAVYEFRVDRRTRADLGVWRRPLDGTAPRRALGPPPPDARFGRTWSTSLGWSMDGDRLAVQSCGEHACRTRLLDPLIGVAELRDEPGHGALLAVTTDELVGYAACDSLPCTVVATDRATGAERVVAATAGPVAVTSSADGPLLAVETSRGVEVRRTDGSVLRTIERPTPEGRLVPTAYDATAAADVPPGWIAWSADGRSPQHAVLTRVSDGRTVPVGEVLP